MCGLFALLLANASVTADQDNSFPGGSTVCWRELWNSLYKIKGRGPDSMKLEEVSKGCIFGFQRLRINDVSEAGDQPIRRGKLSVICNGEIYNYHDLQAKYNFPLKSGSDCEIILHLYEKYGCVDDFIDELDGVFAFVLNDE